MVNNVPPFSTNTGGSFDSNGLFGLRRKNRGILRIEKAVYLLEGEVTFTVNDREFVAQTGMSANMHAGTLYSFQNEQDQPAELLLAVAPQYGVEIRVSQS